MSGGPATLPALLADLATRHGSREALISARGRLRFEALAERVEQVAAGLAVHGVGRGTHVGLLAPNWPEWMVIAFAVWSRGALLVPLNTLYTSRELAHALDHADVRLLIAVRSFLRHDYVAALDGVRAPWLREIVWLDPPPPGAPVDLTPLDGHVVPPPAGPVVQPADPATILFTSGSTAAPKGVVHTHEALVRAALGNAAVLGITPDDRTWGYLPFFFAGGLVAVALGTLAAGAAVVLQEVFEAGETLRLLGAERVSVFFAWPHQAEALLAHPDFPRTTLHLRKGVGANTKWAAALYPPDHQAVSSFGMTETPPLCTAWPWHAPLAKRAGSHGPAVGARQLRIVDPESRHPVTTGAIGEICVRGPELLAGYYKESKPPFDADGFFHTGDLGWLDDDGALHFVGRTKDMVKTAGANVATAEVEAVLLEHAAVGAAYVVGVPDPVRGENVAAFVVPKMPVEEAALLAHCRARLASYKVPRHLWLVREEDLPQKGSGKADKPALRALAARLAGATDGSDPPQSPPRPVP
ncbi:MAG TPA: class I adenylate-forming enzyme family protein [Candidatus Limnocylindria bacterium]|nr:class I adenylate-forming enzyme family protein [Candidatus Limnocylindria bacterium]